MRKRLALALLLTFLVGMAAEAKEGSCVDTGCCVCLCQAPAVQFETISVDIKVIPTITCFVLPGAHIAHQLFDKSLFHPPKTQA